MGGQRTSPWKQKATQALRLSIKHWENLRDGVVEEPRPGAASCECCVQHNGPTTEGNCGQCPIYLRTKSFGCGETPYNKAYREYYGREYSSGGMAEEVDFLKETLRLVRLGEVKL